MCCERSSAEPPRCAKLAMEEGESSPPEETLAPPAALFPVAASSSSVPALFPSFSSAPAALPGVDNAASSAMDWLSNSTFSESLISRPPASASRPADAAVAGGEEQKSPDRASSESEREAPENEGGKRESKERRRRRKSKRKGRKGAEDGRADKREKVDPDSSIIGALEKSEGVERRPAPHAWADVRARAPKEYYFDTRGDRDSLAFGSLYRLDVAKYRRSVMSAQFVEGMGTSSASFLGFGGRSVIEDEVVKAGHRYWSAKLASVARKQKLKHLRLGGCRKAERLSHGPSFPESIFVPITTDLSEGNGGEGQTWLDYVSQKTKELNRLTRERPHDESLWVRFANFQDELIQATNNRTVIQNLIAKKVAILERALDSHKDSEDLLVLYLETSKRSDDAATLQSKWEHAVLCHSGSLRMWTEYLRFRRAQFSTFSISSMTSLYNRALHELAAARNRLSSRWGGEEGPDEDVVEAEEALVSVFVDLCRLNWQAGHEELAVGLFQAEIEYSLFGPRAQLSATARLSRFEEFWQSGARRFGEDGALGWRNHAEEDQRAREAKVAREMQLAEERVGGWTGWSAPRAEPVDLNGDGDLVDEAAAWAAEEDAELDGGDALQEEEDDLALLQKLGLKLDSSTDVEVNDSKIWKRWSEKELKRDWEQWCPLNSAAGDEDEQLDRAVLFEDVKDSLFAIHSQQAKLSLVYQLVDFCDGPLSQWCCSNKGTYISKLDSLVSLKQALVGDLNSPPGQYNVRKSALAELVGGRSWYEESSGRAKFLQNCLGLVKSVFPNDQLLLNAMLKAEDLSSARTGSSPADIAASRALAKKILKMHRKDLLMWGAYACLEGAAGNITTARTVFDTALASLGDPSMGGVQYPPTLCLAYVDLELAQASQGSTDAKHKALYILSCLGSGSVYVPQTNPSGVPATMLLKGQRGFREHLQRLRQTDRRNLSERGGALISCAAIFEQLTNGWEAAAAVFEEGLAMTLPEKRKQSLQCELLHLRYIQMIDMSEAGAKSSRLRSTLLHGLHQYPRNPKLIAAYAHTYSQSFRSYEMRRFFDDTSPKYPSPTLWLSALTCEMWASRTSPRIHRLFERMLESKETHQCVLFWRCYLAYELQVALNPDSARRVYFRAIHACPWSKALWVDGFLMLSSILSPKELSDFVDVMRDKELRLRTDVYEILLEDEAGE